MFQFSCCGVLGPEDFGNGSRFQELHPGTPWPRACCARAGLLQAGELRGWEQCRERSPGYIHEQVGHGPAASLLCPQTRGKSGVLPLPRFSSPVTPQVPTLSCLPTPPDLTLSAPCGHGERV